MFQCTDPFFTPGNSVLMTYCCCYPVLHSVIPARGAGIAGQTHAHQIIVTKRSKKRISWRDVQSSRCKARQHGVKHAVWHTLQYHIHIPKIYQNSIVCFRKKLKWYSSFLQAITSDSNNRSAARSCATNCPAQVVSCSTAGRTVLQTDCRRILLALDAGVNHSSLIHHLLGVQTA